MKDMPEDLTQISSDPTEVFVTEVAGKMRRGSLTSSLITEPNCLGHSSLRGPILDEAPCIR